MGNQAPKLTYSIESSSKKDGETTVRRNPICIEGLKTIPQDNVHTMKDAWLNSVKNYGDCMCLFTRNGTLYEGKTYKEIHNLAVAIGSAIVHENLCSDGNEDSRYPSMKMIGIFAKNCEEWTIADISNMLYKQVMIPLYDTLGFQNITYCLKHSGIKSIFATPQSVSQLSKTQDLVNLKVIITIGEPKPEDVTILSGKDIKFITWNQLLEIGNKNIKEFPAVQDSDCLTFSYTSGTTGDPKAAMMSHKNFISVLASVQFHPNLSMSPSDVHLSYLPMPHVFERVFLYSVLSTGGKVYYYSGDVQKLKEDLSAVNPTFFISVPRLYNRFYDLIKSQFDKATGMKKMLLNKGLEKKMENLRYGKWTHYLYDKLIFSKTKALFGTRCRFLVTSSAPISKDVIDFMKIIACCPMIEGYGQTESSGASFSTLFEDCENDHTGGPNASVEYKLVDIPDMNYFSTDKNKKGELEPRGEICFGGPGIFLGYYKDPVKTAEAVDKDGWLHSGDVGVILAHNKGLKIIDRKKNIFKLQQGEYVAPEKIENSYLKVRGVAEVFVHGDSLQSYTVAIVVPQQPFLEEFAKSMNIEGSFDQLCKNPEITKAFLANLEKQGRADKLAGFELAKKLTLTPTSMADLGCMTNTMKIQRHNAKEVFKNEIEKMYSTPLDG